MRPSASPLFALLCALSTSVAAQAPAGSDYVIRNFRFETGEMLPEMRLHYIALGKPRKDASGKVRNAVVINHGTGGTGGAFMSRRLIMDAIRNDPGYLGGEYRTQPLGLKNAEGFLFIMTSAPQVQQRSAGTRDAADSSIRAYVERGYRTTDANDMLYQFNAPWNDPSKDLEKVSAPVLQINSSDDFVNPPELGIVEQLMTRVKHAKFVLLPITDQTRGHGTHSLPAVWKSYLADFLGSLPER
jgi:homoserine acetyltransferase